MNQPNIPLEKCYRLLKQVDIFQHVPSAVLEDLAKKMILASYAQDSLIILKGEPGNSMYLVIEGKVKIHDEEHNVAEMGEGMLFGEMSILDWEPRSMSVTTLLPTTVGIIHQTDFYQVVKDHPDTMKDIVKVLSSRLRNQNATLIAQLRSRHKELEKLVDEKTHDLQAKNRELTDLLQQLTSTQERLVTQEKLASLGHLTAGIAHEIQNPLNFVNNFSELCLELIRELSDEKSEDERKVLLSNLANTVNKIHKHGKRADSIVRNMMLHSRSGSSEKTIADLNKLSEEYLHLAFHGVRAKDPLFQCQLEFSPDPDLPPTAIVQQDISRVILNLLSNAFYAVNKRKKSGEPGFQSVVRLATRYRNGSAEIRIEDNGTGIPASLLEKIFQPFFTTKPTGEGTGLGLSLSFDIITKGHGGTFQVESEEGKGTSFILTLPVTT